MIKALLTDVVHVVRGMFYLDTRGTEITNGLMATLLGMFYVLPGRQLSASVNQAYAMMNTIAPGAAWGIALGIGGCLQLLCLRRRTYPSFYQWRRVATALLLFLYLLIAACFVVGAPQSAGAVVFALPVIYQAWIYTRIGSNGHTYTRP